MTTTLIIEAATTNNKTTTAATKKQKTKATTTIATAATKGRGVVLEKGGGWVWVYAARQGAGESAQAARACARPRRGRKEHAPSAHEGERLARRDPDLERGGAHAGAGGGANGDGALGCGWARNGAKPSG